MIVFDFLACSVKSIVWDVSRKSLLQYQTPYNALLCSYVVRFVCFGLVAVGTVFFGKVA